MFVLFARRSRRLQERKQGEKKGRISKQTQEMSIQRNRGDKELAMKTTSNQTYMYQRWPAQSRQYRPSDIPFGSERILERPRTHHPLTGIRH